MIPFTKMQGIGNDFVMIDAIARPLKEIDLRVLAISMCDRKFGVGADGVILALRGRRAPFQMRMLNPDGSESEMCGNGIRCFAKFLRDLDYLSERSVEVETGAGELQLDLLEDGRVRVDMGIAHLSRSEIGIHGPGGSDFLEQPVGEFLATAVSMGNPHIVIFVSDVAAIDLAQIGPRLEHDPLFVNRTNVHFAQVVSPTHLIQRTWERGAGVTLACGTGACAVAVAGLLTGRSERKVLIDLPGGQLEIEYLEAGGVLMTGPAQTVFQGTFPNPRPEVDTLDLAGIRELELIELN
jgi:diaminopimelate epimerase